jgi:hypothetical protein
VHLQKDSVPGLGQDANIQPLSFNEIHHVQESRGGYPPNGNFLDHDLDSDRVAIGIYARHVPVTLKKSRNRSLAARAHGVHLGVEVFEVLSCIEG